jgi:hypothetical protein
MNSVELQTWLREEEGNQPRGLSGSAQVVIWLKRSAVSIRCAFPNAVTNVRLVAGSKAAPVVITR